MGQGQHGDEESGDGAAVASLALARVVAALGDDQGFGQALLAWLQPLLAPAHVTAFRFDAGRQPRVVLAASTGGRLVARRSARLYAGAALYRHDPLVGAQTHAKAPANAQAPAHAAAHARAGRAGRAEGAEAADAPATSPFAPQVLHLPRAGIAHLAYATQLWDRHGLVGRLSALAVLHGRWTALNLYRDQATGDFPGPARQRFTGLAPLLLALLQQHLAAWPAGPRTAPPAGEPVAASPQRLTPEAAAALLQRLPQRLSPREADVCALTLAGHGREGIGLLLGLAASSVATLRARAYRKLGIHGTAELFALALRQGLAGPG